MNDIVENTKKNRNPLMLGAALGLATGVAVSPIFYEFPEPSRIRCVAENSSSCELRYACPVGSTNEGPC